MKILIIRLSSIGDIVLVFPLISFLKSKYPESQIDFITKTEYSDLFKFQEETDNLILFDKTKNKSELIRIRNFISKNNYDIIIDLHNNLRSFFLRIFQKSKVFIFNKHSIKKFLLVKFKISFFKYEPRIFQRYFIAFKQPFENPPRRIDFEFAAPPRAENQRYFSPPWRIPERLRENLQGKFPILNRANIKNRIIGLCPFANHFTKIYPSERFVNLCKNILQNYSVDIILFGSKLEFDGCEKIRKELGSNCHNLSGQLSLSETIAVISFCDLIISNDTGLMHIANLLNKNLIAIFGSTVREFGFYPFGNKSYVMQVDNLSCRPCSHIGKEKCPKKHFKCMNEIQNEEIISIVHKILETNKKI